MYDDLLGVIADRPAAKVILSLDGRPAHTYRAVLDALA
jgi:hypothetical protein